MVGSNDKENLRQIWLAGGCFWGVEAYFCRIDGVVGTSVGYANGKTANPSYEEIPRTGHAETVLVNYDPEKISLENILEYFFAIIDPTVKDRQGPDVGKQYRTGIYYQDEEDLPIIQKVLARVQGEYQKPVATEVRPLENYCPAEDYHQDYLKKNPGGYCHIDLNKVPRVTIKDDRL